MYRWNEFMQIRPYNEQTDFAYIKNWISDERTHALWCANLIPFPLSTDSLHQYLEEHENDSGYVFVDKEDRPVGFFIYVVNEQEKSGFLKFVMVDNRLRGQGYGTEMLKRFLRHAYDNTGVSSVKLSVFDVNVGAGKCYEKAGFTMMENMPDAFSYRDEMWGRCIMGHESEE